MKPVLKHGTQDIRELYLAIGYAVSKWEHLETRLFLLYSNLASRDFFSDTQAYSAILSFRARATTIERLAEYRLKNHSETLKQLNTMLERIKRLSQRRNEVVHGQIAHLNNTITRDDSTTTSAGYYVENSIYGSVYDVRHSKKHFAHNANDIIGFGNSFEECRNDLNQLIEKIENADIRYTDA